MPKRWGIWLSVQGDLRFLSHQDMMRVMQRTTARARVPVRYSEGFNPHPRLSLACPRPVGVASNDDLLVLVMDEPIDSRKMLAQLNARAPLGLRFTRAEPLSGARPPQPVRIHYELPLAREKCAMVRDRLTELDGLESWLMQRRAPAGRAWAKAPRTIELKALVEQIRLDDGTLHVVLACGEGMWARPDEVLELAGLDCRLDLAWMVRTKVEYDMSTAPRRG